MKKIALLATFFVLCLASLSAQEKPFRFGFQASPSFSWMRTTDKLIEGAGTNLGLKVGMMGEYYFQGNYAFVSGLGFGLSQGGTLQNGYSSGIFWNQSELSETTKFDTLPLNAKLHYRINYIEIPFGLKMKGGTNEDAKLKYYAEIPVFTLGFVTKAIGDIRGTNSQNTEDENIRDDVNGLSLSWGLGGGIEYEVATNTTLVGGLGYQQQFTDLTADKGYVLKNNTYAGEKSKGTMGMITLRLGVIF